MTLWARVEGHIVDTGRQSPDDFREPVRAEPLTSASYVVGPRSVIVLLRPKGGRG